METFVKKGAMLLISCFATSLLMPRHATAQPGASISFETFYHELAPYGTWIQDIDYGYVWIPDVRGDFQPYMTAGHWIMTEYGNTWVSDYAWGWAPFHYGRWHYDDYYGWMWIPGTEWGPAWVAWRTGGGYYGWAPLGPGINVNISVNIGRYIPSHHWIFVRQRYFTHPRFYSYCAPRRHVTRIIHHTTIINNTYVYNNRHTYYTGPEVRDIERVTRNSVKVHRVHATDRPGATVVRNGAVSVYRPAVQNSRGNFVPSATPSRRSTTYQPARSAQSRTSARQATPSHRSSAASVGESRQGVENRINTRSSQSYPSSTREANSSNRARESMYGRTGEHTSNRSGISTPDRTRERSRSNVGSRENRTYRSEHAASPSQRTTSGSTYSRKRSPSQQRQSSSVQSTRPSRQAIKSAPSTRQSTGQQTGRSRSSRGSSRPD